VYRHSGREPHFTIAYPTLWEVVPAIDNGPGGFTTITFNGAHASTPAQFAVVAVPETDFQGNTANDIRGVLTAWFRDELRQDVTLGPWTGHEPLAFTFDQGTTAYDGLAWERTAHGQVWLLYGYSIPEISPIFAPVFRRMVASWTPTLTPTAAPADQSNWLGDVGVPGLVLGLLPLLIALGLGLPLLRRWRQGRGGPLAAAGLFALVCGALLFGQYLPQVAAVARLPAERVPSLDLAGMRVVVALATLGLLGWMLGRRAPPAADVAEPLAMLFALNGGLLVVALMAALYEGALLVRFGVAQAVIVLLALLWDTTMSGEQVTNVEGRLFPRPARVLLFLGYIMLVSAAVLYFTSWQVQATGAPVAEAIFESELWPREGLLGLGVPLLFVSFTLGLTRWLAQRNLRGEGADTLARGDLVEVAMTMDGEVGVARAPEKT
jgi:hypothetical protein